MLSIILLLSIQLIKISSECETNAMLWTYYPCSFIISSTRFYCQHVTVTSIVDQCINREMLFFWHFPLSNLTLTLQSETNQVFLVHLSQTLPSTNKLIRNIYYHSNDQTSEQRLIYDNGITKLVSNQCSIRFETTISNIFDYGTFIRIKIFSLEQYRINPFS